MVSRGSRRSDPRGRVAARPLGPPRVGPGLTTAQRRAVTHGRGPCLVLAGAGTGKTHVLVERIAWLIGTRHVSPQHILALTFTEKAADELQARVDAAVPISAFQPWIGTFHAFGEAVLREEAVQLGLSPSFRILTPPEAWLLLKRHLFDLPLQRYRPLGNPTRFVPALAQFFSACKEQGITPEALASYARQGSGVGGRGTTARVKRDPRRTTPDSRPEWRELADVYRASVDLQRREGVMDFGDLLLETLRLFAEHPEAVQKYRARYPEILVDEFQDTNATQFQLLELLGAPPANLLAVSDDDQAIYAFRGSNVEHVIAFQERFGGPAALSLTDSFRSPQVLLDHAYRLIQHNNPYRLEATAGVSKKLTSRVPEAGNRKLATGVQHLHFATEEEEFAWVGSEILRLVEGGSAYGDLALLTRTNAQAADLVPSLLRRDIPHVVAEARGLLARPEVQDILAYFRLLADPTDARALFRLAVHPAVGLNELDTARLLADLRRRKDVVLATLQDEPLLARCSESGRVGLRRLAHLVRQHLTRLRTLTPSTIFLEFLEGSGLLKAAVAASDRHPEVLPNLQAFLGYLRQLERGARGDFFELLEVLEAAIEGGEGPAAAHLPAEVDAVRVLTVHAAKGLEFPVVFLVGASADRFPARGRHRPLELPPDLLPAMAAFSGLDDRHAHILEERRLFYVALTRARERLILTSSAAAAGTRRTRKPSPFIAEAGIPSLVIAVGETTPEQQLALPLTTPVVPQPPADAAVRLTASKIADYTTCPWKYRFRYVLGVPTPPSAALAFGTTIHDVLRDLGRAVADGQRPALADALRLYDQRWVSDGYADRQHEAARKESGRVALTAYLTAHRELLERAPLAVEASFALQLPTTKLTGRIDRIDRLADGSVLVTDFKTGEGKGKEAATDVQLSLYALALRRAFGWSPGTLKLSFVETGREEETTRLAAVDAETEQYVEELAGRIRRGDFRATPGFHCRFCDFRNICDHAER